MKQHTIEDIILSKHDINEAISRLRQSLNDFCNNGDQETLLSIENDYRLMCDSYANGVYDPHGADVYKSLLRRVYMLYNTVRLASVIRKRSTYHYCKKVAEGVQLYDGNVRCRLEEFVQDVAMASLNLDSEQYAAKKLHALHQRYMDTLFSAILVSGQWNDDAKKEYIDTLLSPTIDQNDALLIVSAMTMALMSVFDANKWLVLSTLYTSGKTVYMRQRALVGLALTLPHNDLSLFPEIEQVLANLCKAEVTRNQLVELQIQLIYCTRTESENKEIQRDILPTLAKNNKFEVTRNGIVEKEDDPLGDIINGNSADKKMAELEDKINKMAEMQKNGSDIYFGGFAQMKRFSFFYQLSNWFLPFSAENPDVASSLRCDVLNVIDGIVGNGPFCDSDKYSFAFALSSVYDSLPESVREMLTTGGVNAGVAVESDVDKASSSYVRRMYLQDLYRFYALYKDKNDFDNPFDCDISNGSNSGILFIASKTFSKYLQDEIVKVEKFCFSHALYNNVLFISENRYKQGVASSDEAALLAYSYLRLERFELAKRVFKKLAECNPKNANYIKGLAFALFDLCEYEESAKAFKRLMDIDGNSEYSALRYGLALANADKVKDALPILFKLNYENQENISVKRALAWGLLMDMRPREAERIYDEIILSGSSVYSDFLNAGYSKWFQKKNKEACTYFLKYVEKVNCGLDDSFKVDEGLLSKYDIKNYELHLMSSLVSQTRRNDM